MNDTMPREVPDFSKMSVHNMSEAMSKVNLAAGEHLEETMASVWEAIKRGAMPKDILELDPQTIEYFYAQAYRMYNQGKYKEALYIFQLLLLLDPGQARHALGSAACLHRMGKYEAAGQIYMVTAPLDPENPLPYFHASDCYCKLQVYELAEFNLEKCLELCKDKEKFALIKERAEIMKEMCKTEIEKRDKEEVPEKKAEQ